MRSTCNLRLCRQHATGQLPRPRTCHEAAVRVTIVFGGQSMDPLYRQMLADRRDHLPLLGSCSERSAAIAGRFDHGLRTDVVIVVGGPRIESQSVLTPEGAVARSVVVVETSWAGTFGAYPGVSTTRLMSFGTRRVPECRIVPVCFVAALSF